MDASRRTGLLAASALSLLVSRSRRGRGGGQAGGSRAHGERAAAARAGRAGRGRAARTRRGARSRRSRRQGRGNADRRLLPGRRLRGESRRGRSARRHDAGLGRPLLRPVPPHGRGPHARLRLGRGPRRVPGGRRPSGADRLQRPQAHAPDVMDHRPRRPGRRASGSPEGHVHGAGHGHLGAVRSGEAPGRRREPGQAGGVAPEVQGLPRADVRDRDEGDRDDLRWRQQVRWLRRRRSRCRGPAIRVRPDHHVHRACSRDP